MLAATCYDLLREGVRRGLDKTDKVPPDKSEIPLPAK